MHTHTKHTRLQTKNYLELTVSHNEDILGNLLMLLGDEKNESQATVENLPTNDDVIKALSSSVPVEVVKDYILNEMCIVIWGIGHNEYKMVSWICD